MFSPNLTSESVLLTPFTWHSYSEDVKMAAGWKACWWSNYLRRTHEADSLWTNTQPLIITQCPAQLCVEAALMHIHWHGLRNTEKGLCLTAEEVVAEQTTVSQMISMLSSLFLTLEKERADVESVDMGLSDDYLGEKVIFSPTNRLFGAEWMSAFKYEWLQKVKGSVHTKQAFSHLPEAQAMSVVILPFF